MKIPHPILLGLLVSISSSWALAQTTPATPASAPATQDCGKAGMAPHNHGAEKNTGVSPKKGCAGMDASAKKADASDTAASAPKAKASAAHDHAKFHKNQ